MKPTATVLAGMILSAGFALPVLSQVSSCVGLPDGTPCTDGDACTYGEACFTESCVGGWPITCTSDSCATRACNGTATCAVLSTAPDGTPCEDLNPCTQGDTCQAGGCTGMAVGNNLLVSRLSAGSSTSLITWSLPTGGTRSDLVRGALSCLPVSPTGVCESPLVQNQNTTQGLDPSVPAPGTGYWYLARARNACGAGRWGFETVHGQASVLRVSNGGCVPDAAASPRYVDNGLTVTDRTTCFEWEKKRNAPGVNDVNDGSYGLGHWECCYFLVPDGTAYTLFLQTLNDRRFARHKDWRLPSEEGRNSGSGPNELEAILRAPYLCDFHPCIDSIFGATALSPYWSTSWKGSDILPRFDIWTVDFDNGYASPDAWQTQDPHVRAVRGAP
jgi:hypothetical protein